MIEQVVKPSAHIRETVANKFNPGTAEAREL